MPRDMVITNARNCLNMLIEPASGEATNKNKMYIVQNWIKSKTVL